MNLNEPVHKILVLIACVNSERSDEPAQSRQRIRCSHTYNSRWIMSHLRHRNFQFRYIYEGVRLLSVYTQLSSGVIGLGFDLNSNSAFIFLHK